MAESPDISGRSRSACSASPSSSELRASCNTVHLDSSGEPRPAASKAVSIGTQRPARAATCASREAAHGISDASAPMDRKRAYCSAAPSHRSAAWRARATSSLPSPPSIPSSQSAPSNPASTAAQFFQPASARASRSTSEGVRTAPPAACSLNISLECQNLPASNSARAESTVGSAVSAQPGSAADDRIAAYWLFWDEGGTPTHIIKRTEIDPRNFTEQYYPARKEIR